MSLALARTKIVATLGPASSTREVIARLMDAGADVFRLNFSHGDLETHGRTLAVIRELAAERSEPIAVLGDLCGPKIRLTELVGDSALLAAGAAVALTRGPGPSAAERLRVSYDRIVEDVQVGQRVFIDDGLVRLVVRERRQDELICEVVVGGVVRSRKGVNLPDSRLSTPALTEKDRVDATWAVRSGLDYLALSFVRQPDDLYELKRLLKSLGSSLPVVVKIEKTEALDHLSELLDHAGGVMVARGDLGVETDVWRVPLIQKEIVQRCRRQGVPVIVATQMLQSMMDNPMPTRAEVSDVANAVLDQADAVMLSGETAAGRYPVEAVEMMSHVVSAAAEYLDKQPRHSRRDDLPYYFRTPAALAHAAARAALDLSVRLVAVWSATGTTVRLVARHRLPMPVVGLTHDERTWRRMNLLYGVVPVRTEPTENPAELISRVDSILMRSGLVVEGDQIVVVGSTAPLSPGETNVVLVHRVEA
ncbi:MAG: pyruvate kinase [Phycisphaerales bacterium]|nr:pyruvate kinase [Phycisphaerales bacterium]